MFSFLTPKKTAPTIPHEAVVPWAHRRSHLAILATMATQQQREPLKWMPLGDAYAFTLALTATDGMVPMKSEHRAALGLDDERLVRLALQNAAGHFAGAQMAEGLAIFQTSHGIAGAGLLLLSALVGRLPLKGAPVAMLPEENVLLVAGADDPAALALLIKIAEAAFADSEEWRSLRAVTTTPGSPQLADWLPPADHPLYLRFKAAAARTRVREIATEHAVLLDGAPPLAPLAVDTDGALVAAWTRGARVAIARHAERVLLVDDPGTVRAVSPDSLRDACEPLGDSFWSAHRFPSTADTPVIVDGDDALAAQLFPILRAPGYDAASRASMAGIVAGNLGAMKIASVPERAAFPVGEGVAVEIVRDAGAAMHTLPPELVERREAARNTALMNLRAASVGAWRDVAPGAFAAPWHDGYTASRMLLPELAGSLAVRGAPLFFAPTVGRLWVAGDDDAAAIGVVLDEIEAFFASGEATSPYEWRELLFGRPWLRTDGALALWTPPAAHPHAARMRALDDALAARRGGAADRAYQFSVAAARPMASGEA